MKYGVGTHASFAATMTTMNIFTKIDSYYNTHTHYIEKAIKNFSLKSNIHFLCGTALNTNLCKIERDR